jgi:hypothetical protein
MREVEQITLRRTVLVGDEKKILTTTAERYREDGVFLEMSFHFRVRVGIELRITDLREWRGVEW